VAVSESFLTFVLEQLDGVPGVVTKRMFGGVGIYGGEVFFAVIDNDTLFFRVDEASVVKYRAAGMPPFAPIPGKPPMLSYYQVPPEVLEDADEIKRWARESLGTKRPRVRSRKVPKGRSRKS
jgi:DNA transformation protein